MALSLCRVRVIMTMKSFILGRSLNNAIFFQTFLLNLKFFHKIIVLIWLQPSRKRKKFRVKSMLKCFNFILMKGFLPPSSQPPCLLVSNSDRQVMCPFFLLFWQPAVGAMGFPSLLKRDGGVEHSSAPMRALDKTTPIFNIHGCCKFSQRILNSKGKRSSVLAGLQKLSPSLLLAVGWQQTVTVNRGHKSRPLAKAMIKCQRDSSIHLYSSPPAFHMLQNLSGSNEIKLFLWSIVPVVSILLFLWERVMYVALFWDCFCVECKNMSSPHIRMVRGYKTVVHFTG